MEYKTTVMKILDKQRINYKSYQYIDAISGIEVANSLNENPNKVFKTLVTIGHSKKYYVFDVPANKELDFKKAALSVNEKNIEMIKSNDLLAVTGYIHGGCSPIGMKKKFITIIDNSASLYDTIYISGGKIGYQIEISLDNLKKVIDFKLDSITK